MPSIFKSHFGDGYKNQENCVHVATFKHSSQVPCWFMEFSTEEVCLVLLVPACAEAHSKAQNRNHSCSVPVLQVCAPACAFWSQEETKGAGSSPVRRAPHYLHGVVIVGHNSRRFPWGGIFKTGIVHIAENPLEPRQHSC